MVRTRSRTPGGPTRSLRADGGGSGPFPRLGPGFRQHGKRPWDPPPAERRACVRTSRPAAPSRSRPTRSAARGRHRPGRRPAVPASAQLPPGGRRPGNQRTGRRGRTAGPARGPDRGRGSGYSRSALLRSTQNSLPSGSFRTAQPVPSEFRKSAASVAPRTRSRSTSSSRVRSCG